MPPIYKWRLAHHPATTGFGDTWPYKSGERELRPAVEVEIFCPACQTWKRPAQPSRGEAIRRTAAYEQWLTGLCSDKCWNDYLGRTDQE